MVSIEEPVGNGSHGDMEAEESSEEEEVNTEQVLPQKKRGRKKTKTEFDISLPARHLV